MKYKSSHLFFSLALLFSATQSMGMIRLTHAGSRTAVQLANRVAIPQANKLQGLRLAASARIFSQSKPLIGIHSENSLSLEGLSYKADAKRPISVQELNAHLEQAIRAQAEHAKERNKLLDEIEQLEKSYNTYAMVSVPFLMYGGYALTNYLATELGYFEKPKK